MRRLHNDPRVEHAGLEAVGLFALAVSWMAHHRFTTIARDDLARFAGRKAHWLTMKLLEAGMLERAEGGFRAVTFEHEPPPVRARTSPRTPPGSSANLPTNPPRFESATFDEPPPVHDPPFPTATPHHAPHAPDAQARPRYLSPSAESGSALGSLDRDPKTETSGRGAGETNPGPEALPLPASETPIPSSAVKPKKAPRAKGIKIPIPDDWTHKPEHVAQGAELRFDAARVELEARNFADSAVANGRTYIDWDAAFRTWLRRERGFADDRAAKFGGAGPASKNGREVDDWARPQDSDNWPEAKLVRDLIPMPPPPPLGDPPPIPEHLKNLSPAEIERRINEAPGFHGWEPRR